MVRPLSGDFKVIREHIQQVIADMFTDITTLIDIKDFQKALNKSFKDKGLLTTFRNQVIQAPKKNMSASKAGIEKEAKEDTLQQKNRFRTEFSKKKVSPKTDMDFKQEVAAIASKLCDDSNKTNEVTSHKDIKAFFAEKKNTGCWNCLSINCFKKQRISKELNKNIRLDRKCPNKKLTFTSVGALVTSWGSNPSVAKPVTNGNEYDSDMEDIFGTVNKMKNTSGSSNTEYGYAEEMVANFSTRPALIEENFPIWRSGDKNANKENKICLICMKSRMAMERLANHLDEYHSLYIY